MKVDLDALERVARSVMNTRSAFELAQWCASHTWNNRRWRTEQMDAAAAHAGANSPDVTLALVRRIRELEAALLKACDHATTHLPEDREVIIACRAIVEKGTTR